MAEVPPKPEIPVYTKKRGERVGENRAVLCWSIECSECGYAHGSTNYSGARDSTLKRLTDQGRVCPECGASSWHAVEQSD